MEEDCGVEVGEIDETMREVDGAMYDPDLIDDVASEVVGDLDEIEAGSDT